MNASTLLVLALAVFGVRKEIFFSNPSQFLQQGLLGGSAMAPLLGARP